MLFLFFSFLFNVACNMATIQICRRDLLLCLSCIGIVLKAFKSQKHEIVWIDECVILNASFFLVTWLSFLYRFGSLSCLKEWTVWYISGKNGLYVHLTQTISYNNWITFLYVMMRKSLQTEFFGIIEMQYNNQQV